MSQALSNLSCQHIFPVFPRKSENGVHHHFKSCLSKPAKCILEAGKRIAPADIGGSRFMDGLQSKLYPDGLSFIQAREKFYHILSQAVWTGAEEAPQSLDGKWLP